MVFTRSYDFRSKNRSLRLMQAFLPSSRCTIRGYRQRRASVFMGVGDEACSRLVDDVVMGYNRWHSIDKFKKYSVFHQLSTVELQKHYRTEYRWRSHGVQSTFFYRYIYKKYCFLNFLQRNCKDILVLSTINTRAQVSSVAIFGLLIQWILELSFLVIK